MSKYYVYRFKDKHEQIVYVGKTKNLKTRMRQHFSPRGHLTEQQYASIETVEYVELPTKIDMDIKELYYINKWKPAYNTSNVNHNTASTIIADDDEWIIYSSKKKNSEYALQDKISVLEKELATKIKMIRDIESENVQLRNSNIELTRQIENLDKALNQSREKRHIAIVNTLGNYEQDSDDYTDMTFVKVRDALRLAKHFSEYRFVSKITGKNTHIFEIYHDGGIAKIKESLNNDVVEIKVDGSHRDVFIAAIIDKFDNTIVTTGQSDTEIVNDLRKVTELETLAKEQTEKVRSFVEKADYKTRDSLGYAFLKFVGQFYNRYGDADYSKVYRLMVNNDIKTPKQLLSALDEINGDKFDAA